MTEDQGFAWRHSNIRIGQLLQILLPRSNINIYEWLKCIFREESKAVYIA